MTELLLSAVLVSQLVILVTLVARRRSVAEQAEGGQGPLEPVGDSSVVEAAAEAAETMTYISEEEDEAAVEALLHREELAIQVGRSEPFLHLRFEADLPTESQPADDPNLTRLMGSLSGVLPLLPKGLPDGYMVARFAPEVAAMLNSGQARLMVSQGQEVMKAVSTTNGQVIATARRVSQSSVGIGAAALGPVAILGAVVVVAASWHHQRWVDRTLGRIARSTAALETRGRDDDFGTILAGADAAQRYLDVVEFARPTAPVIIQELTAASLDVNKLYHARIRRVHAFLGALDQLQDDHEQRTGRAVAWSKGVDQLLSDGDRFLQDAIIAVQTAMTRAKLQALLSIELALQGDGGTAQHNLVTTLDACNNEVHSLRRRIHALASSQPRLAAVRSKARQAADSVGRLDHFFDNGVLDLLPERVEASTPVELVVPVASLEPGREPNTGSPSELLQEAAGSRNGL